MEAPELKEELERKVRETMIFWLESVTSGQSEPADAKRALETLWGVAAGLIPRDDMDALSDAISALESVPGRFKPRRIYTQGHKALIVTQTRPEEFTVDNLSGKRLMVYSLDEGQTPMELSERLDKMDRAFTQQGWIEI